MIDPTSVSRLERLLARLTAQKAWLDEAARRIVGLEGPVLEVGLGKGRTYDHLRHLFGHRRIVAFDRELHAPEAARPAAEDLVLGDFRETLERYTGRLGGQPAALIHADFGSPDPAFDRDQARWLGPMLRSLAQPGAVILSDRPLPIDGCAALPPPRELAWPYYGLQVPA